MNANTIRGLLFSMLIGAAMVAGVLLAAPSKATPEQDYQFFALLENNGMSVLSPSAAKRTAADICNSLASGRYWKLVITDLMNGGDWTLQQSSTVFGAAVLTYCPSFDPRITDTTATEVA